MIGWAIQSMGFSWYAAWSSLREVIVLICD